MKKTLAIILCAVMLLASIPVVSFAADTYYEKSETLSDEFTMTAGNTYTVTNGATLTVPSGSTLYIANGATLKVEEGAKLVVNGDIITYTGSEVVIDGTLLGGKNISGSGNVEVEVRFAELYNYVTSDAVDISYAFSENLYDDTKEIKYTALNKKQEKSTYVPLNSYLFIKATICEEEEANLGHDKYDDSLYNVYMNGSAITYGQGNHYVQITTGADITYDKWQGENYYLSTFPVYLPSGDGYTVYSKTGETGTVNVKYGTPISFRVEIDEEYDMSQYEVYIYNGYGWTGLDTSTLLGKIDPAEPDEYGYYTIKTDDIEGVVGETTVYVVGVMENETITMLGDVMQMIKNIFEMFASLFAEFFALLGFNSGTVA